MYNVLSLFDGISVANLALKRAGIPVNKFMASELDRHAIKVAMANHPEIIQLGDVRNITAEVVLSHIDNTDNLILVGGSPCQDLSSLGRGAGLSGERSGLFFEYLRLLQELKPKYFLLENVASMSNKDQELISQLLGVKPIMINSSLVSGQCRKRLYWTSIPGVNQPKDKSIHLQDILTDGYADRQKAHTILTNQLPETAGGLDRYLFKCTGQVAFKEKYFAELDKQTKSERYANMDKLGLMPKGCELYKNGVFRHLNVHELEALQCLPKDYTGCGISKSQRYKCLGNSFTCDVVTHIFRYIPK